MFIASKSFGFPLKLTPPDSTSFFTYRFPSINRGVSDLAQLRDSGMVLLGQAGSVGVEQILGGGFQSLWA